MNYPVHYREPSPLPRAYAGDHFSDSDDEQLASAVNKKTPQTVAWERSTAVTNGKKESTSIEEEEEFCYPAASASKDGDVSLPQSIDKPIFTSPVESLHDGFSRAASPTRPRGPSDTDVNDGSELKKRRIDSGFVELSEKSDLPSKSIVKSVKEERATTGLGWEEEPRSRSITVNGWIINAASEPLPASSNVVETSISVVEAHSADAYIERSPHIWQPHPIQANKALVLPAKKEKTVSLDEYLSSNGEARITCDKCGSILSKKEFETRTGGSGVKAYTLPTSSNHALIKSDSILPSQSVSQASSSRVSEASYETMSPSFPPGYIPEDIAKGWGSGYVSASSSKRSAASSFSIPPSLPSDTPTPEDLRLGWKPVDGSPSSAGSVRGEEEEAGRDDTSDIVVKKAIEQISALSLDIGNQERNEKQSLDIERPVSPVSYRMSAGSPASTIVASGWKVELPIFEKPAEVFAADAPTSGHGLPITSDFSSPAQSMLSSQATLVNSGPLPVEKQVSNGWIVPESSVVVDRKQSASPSLLRAQVSALLALDNDVPVKVVGWGDPEDNAEENERVPAVGWSDQRPLKQPKSPSYPISSNEAGRSPENSAAPRDRQLVPSVSEWRNGVSNGMKSPPMSSPVVEPTSPVQNHNASVAPAATNGWTPVENKTIQNAVSPIPVQNGWTSMMATSSPSLLSSTERSIQNGSYATAHPAASVISYDRERREAPSPPTSTSIINNEARTLSGWIVPNANGNPALPPARTLSPTNGYSTQSNAGDSAMSNGLPKHFSSSFQHALKGSAVSKWSTGASSNVGSYGSSPPPRATIPLPLRTLSPATTSNGWNVNAPSSNLENNGPPALSLSNNVNNGWNVPAVFNGVSAPVQQNSGFVNGSQMNRSETPSNEWGVPGQGSQGGRVAQTMPPRFEKPDGAMTNANRTPLSNARGWGSTSTL